MTNKEWKEGFEAGISFALTMINEQCDANFEGLGSVVYGIKALKDAVNAKQTVASKSSDKNEYCLGDERFYAND